MEAGGMRMILGRYLKEEGNGMRLGDEMEEMMIWKLGKGRG